MFACAIGVFDLCVPSWFCLCVYVAVRGFACVVRSTYGLCSACLCVVWFKIVFVC